MNEITVILEKNATTGIWKAFVLQSGVRGPNLCTGKPTTPDAAKTRAERTLRNTKFTGNIRWEDGGPQKSALEMATSGKRDDYGIRSHRSYRNNT